MMADDNTPRPEPSSNGPVSATSTAARPDTPLGAASDGEDERSARERLKKTSIANLPQQTILDAAVADSATTNEHSSPAATENNGVRGRPAKKRSFEDLARDEADGVTAAPGTVGQPPLPKSGHHKRMRSRDVASGEHEPVVFDNSAAQTVREETDVEAGRSPGGPGVLIEVPSQEEMERDDAARRQHGQSASTHDQTDTSLSSKIEPTSGFANTSSTSPFGASQSKSPQSQPTSLQPQPTSSSAFASSGLSAFASSDKSPFGAASSKSPPGTGFGGTTSGGFGAASSTGGFGVPASASASSTGFGNTSSTSAFGSTSSSVFGTPKPFGSTTTSTFGAPPSGAFGSSATTKPFGTPAPFGNSSSASGFGTGKPFGSSAKDDDDDEDGDQNEDGEDGETTDQPTERDPRFFEQHVDTGEEDEDTYFSSRAKLYHFEGEWKERGTGVIKINLRYLEETLSPSTDPPKSTETTENSTTRDTNDDPEAEPSNFTVMKRKARVLMRADGVHRVILNSPIFKGMKFGTSEGKQPLGRVMYLQSLGEDGVPHLMQIKVGREETLKEFWHKLQELEEEA